MKSDPMGKTILAILFVIVLIGLGAWQLVNEEGWINPSSELNCDGLLERIQQEDSPYWTNWNAEHDVREWIAQECWKSKK